MIPMETKPFALRTPSATSTGNLPLSTQGGAGGLGGQLREQREREGDHASGSWGPGSSKGNLLQGPPGGNNQAAGVVFSSHTFTFDCGQCSAYWSTSSPGTR
uniref:Uncharacterized protein n=1 Tax=Chromera velia CCMP2878 TaxID=1169474 RepID=A0A0G4H502_9ALVE|eukprot:Cvel_5710.t1-p1 / transcript=Cvel_5710.t1 / gene=Cvel_5710 / organism=Chromera_velia_CCMP2878 / gene_product=hypothetical protein / transcript_product=hypothetical protein / location=Cvel_scaffold270:53011-53313(-) / protein_length=101 / sequence_SO=supercontig / SO=protein_coding / is_pseudo=false